MIKPINGMLLVEEQESSEKRTASGLVISAAISDLGPKRGKIVSVGNGEMNHFTGGVLSMAAFSEGDIILYPDNTGTEIEDTDGKTYLLLHNKYILGKIVE
jgi:co-chaperonin GroES (HSP10)